MIVTANTIHGIFNYTIINLVISPTVEAPAVETLVHSLLLVWQYYLFIQVKLAILEVFIGV